MATKNVYFNSYMKNLARSAKYIGMDVFKSYAPVMTELASSSKEAASNGYQAIKAFTDTSGSSDFSFKNITNKGGQAISNIWKNTIDDLKTGKIYNQERKDALDNEMLEGMFGEGFSFDDFDFDDWGDDDSSSDETKAQISAELEGSKVIVNAVDAMGKGISASLTTATVESASYIADSARENTQALFNLNKEGFGSINKALMSINETIYGFSKIGEPLSAHMQNSLNFFTRTEEKLTNIEQTLKQIEKNTTPPVAAGNKGYKSSRNLGSVMSDDTGINFGELKEQLSETVNEYKELVGFIGSMTGAGSISKNNAKNISLASMGATALVKKIIPKAVEESLKGLDESIKYGLGAGLTKAASGRTGNALLDLLLPMVLPQRASKRSISTSNYEKGPVAWDGISRKALIDVIPTTLLQIYSVLTDSEPLRFDYNTGKYVKTSAISKDFSAQKRKYVEESGGALYEEIVKNIKESGKTQKQQEKMLSEAYKYFEKAFDSGDHSIMTNDNGIDAATYALIKSVAQSRMNRGGSARRSINKWVVDTNKAAADYEDYLKREEAQGTNPYIMMHQELLGNGKGSGKKGNKSTVFGLDEYGHNYYFYLQGIWQYTNYLASNMGSFTGGQATVGPVSPGISKMPDIPKARRSGERTLDEVNEYIGLYTDDEEKRAANRVRDSKTKAGELIQSLNNKAKYKINEIFGTNLSTEEYAAASIMDNISDAIDRLIFGSDDNPENGIMNFMFKKTEDLFNNAKEWFKTSIIDKFKDWFKDKVADKWNQSEWVSDTKRVLVNVKDSFKGSVRKVFIGDNGNAAYGRKITKSGIVTVSEGELIIPSEYNPFYHGATNKAAQIANERRIGGGFPGFARGDIEYFTKDGQSATYNEKSKRWRGSKGFVKKSDIVYRDVSGKWFDVDGKQINPPGFANFKDKFDNVKGKVSDNSIFGLLFNGASNAFYGLKNRVDEMTDKEQLEKDKKNMSNAIANALGEVGGAKGEIGAGAILGVAGSILTGGIFGPIAGAALGAGIGFLSKSKAAQDLLFGPEEEDDEGNVTRKRQKLYDFVMKDFPDVAKGAAVGGALGMFGGSPLIGSFLGAGITFAAKSEKFKTFLLGEVDEESKKRIGGLVSKKVQQAMPNIALGTAIGGLLTPIGPLGIIGNALLGSVIGYSATAGSLHKVLLGEDKDDKESVIYITKEKIFGGIDDLFHNMKNRFNVWIKELGKSVRDKLVDKIDKIKTDAKEGRGGLGTRLLGGMLNFGDRTLGRIVRTPFRMVGGLVDRVNTSYTKGNLARGYGAWNRKAGRNMTAQEREDARTNLKVKWFDGKYAKAFQNFDKLLMKTTDPEKLRFYKKQIEIIRTEPEDSVEYKRAMESLDNDKEFKEFLQSNGNKSARQMQDFLKKNSTRLTGLINDETNREDLSEEKQTILREQRKINAVETIAEYIKAIAVRGVKIDESKESLNIPVDGKGAVHSLAAKEYKLKDSDSDNNDKEYVTDGDGNQLNVVTDDKGNKTINMKDKKTNEAVKEKSKFKAAIMGIPTAIGGIGTKVKEALFGDGKEKDGIFGKVKKFFSKIVSKVLKPIATLALVGFGIYALVKGLFGSEDSFTNKIANKIGSIFGFGRASNNPFDLGGTKTQFQDADGNILKGELDENGVMQYFNESGEMVDPSQVSRVKAGPDTFISTFKKGNLRQLVTGKTMLAGKMGKGLVSKIPFIGKKASSQLGKAGKNLSKFKANYVAKAGEKGWAKLAGEEFGDSLTYSMKNSNGAVASKVKEALDGILKHLDDFPMIPAKVKNVLPSCFDDLAETLGKNAGKFIGKVGQNISDAIPVINVIMMVSDFVTGYEDARSTLGITAEPSIPQRLVSGLLRLVKNLIPVIGPFIPDKLIVDVFCKWIAPVFGIEPKELMKQREAAEAEVKKYNEEHGTDYTVQEYNKAVLNDYTFTERIGNAFKTTKQQFKDKKDKIKNAKGFKGKMSALFNVDEMKEAFNKTGGGFKGVFEASKKMFSGSGVFGEIQTKMMDMFKNAITGNPAFFDPNSTTLESFKDSKSEKGVKSTIFSKYVGGLPFQMMKLTLTPVALITSGVRGVFGKIKEAFKPIMNDWDGLKTYAKAMLKNQKDGKDDSEDSSQKDYEAKSKLAPLFNFGAKVIKVISIFKNMISYVMDFVGNITDGIIDKVKNSKVGKLATETVDAVKNSTVGKAAKKTAGWVKSGVTWLKSKFTGSGSGLRGRATGLITNNCNNCESFISQLDDRYKNIPFAGSNIGENGCGPAVAAMASTSMGGNMDMNAAINKAKSYTNHDGTSIKYFKDTLNASEIKGTKTVTQALESGRPVILLGRDPSNTSKVKSPFGPNNHYVLATAMKNGKVLVNDPENKQPMMYDKSILNKSNVNLTYGGYSGFRGRGGSVSRTDVSDIIFNTLKAEGFSDAAAAGILGNAQQESSMSPTANAAAYGLFQFEKSTGAANGLESYASGLGKSKDDVETQTKYMLSLFKDQVSAYSGNGTYTYPNGTVTWWPQKVTLDDYKGLTDAAEAAEIFERTYERPSVPMRENRKNYAKDFYELYSGTYNGSTSSSSSSSSDSSSSSSGGILDELSRIFGSLTNIFNVKDGFSINSSESSGSSSSGSSGSVSNASGAAAAATAASNEIGYAESGNNITKFGQWSGCNGQPWCGAFAAWAIAQAFDGSKDKAVKALYNCPNVNYTPTLTDTFKANNAWYDEPEVGDEVMYGNPGAYHVGLVTSVDKSAKTFESVEGNTSDKVTKKSHTSYKDGNVIGFGRPDYSGATAQIASNGNGDTAATMSGNDTSFKATGSGLLKRGGSSGLLRRAAPSRYAYGALKGHKFRFGSAAISRGTRNRFRGAGSDLSATVTRTLTSIKSNISNGESYRGIDPALITELLGSITTLLNSIANNTAPTERIYNALTEYIDFVKGNKSNRSNATDRVNMPTNDDEIQASIAGLVNSLSAIARG